MCMQVPDCRCSPRRGPRTTALVRRASGALPMLQSRNLPRSSPLASFLICPRNAPGAEHDARHRPGDLSFVTSHGGTWRASWSTTSAAQKYPVQCALFACSSPHTKSPARAALDPPRPVCVSRDQRTIQIVSPRRRPRGDPPCRSIPESHELPSAVHGGTAGYLSPGISMSHENTLPSRSNPTRRYRYLARQHGYSGYSRPGATE